ncbi:MAG: CHAP domain-containing protein [Clostridia bacterium]|nr:CHAP domain-containing protein [Clostridia bacterium]MBR6809768.1 CHAP domain-containing protein [Clostridia bacterium]
MMKRILCSLLVLCSLFSCALAEPLPDSLSLRAGESLSFSLPFSGSWDSDAPDVAYAEGDTVHALQEGWAQLVLMNGESEFVVDVEVTDPVPQAIRDAIAIALQEWDEVNEKRLDKTKKGNKYIKWWGYENIGWCGAFVGYCLDTAGVPLEPSDNWRKVKPLPDGRPYSLREAGVPKLRTGFTNMERITDVPRPGYLIIFGAKNYYADVHVGMITHAVDMGNGLYQIFTVEGNIGGSTVKRFSFLYDSKAEDIKTNMSYLPQEEWTEEGVHYEGPRQTKSDGKKYNWYVQAICQTWQ